MDQVTEDLDKLMAELNTTLGRFERNPNAAITCGEVASLIRMALKIGDHSTAYAIRSLTALAVQGFVQMGAKHEEAIKIFAQHVKGYIDGKVEPVEQAITEVRKTTWN